MLRWPCRNGILSEEGPAGGPSRIPRPLAPPDLLRQRRDAADHPRVEGELAAVVLLVADAAVQPGQTRSHEAVEAPDVLEHDELPRRPEAFRPVGVALPQQREQLR